MKKLLSLLLLNSLWLCSQHLLIPMDAAQRDHLRAYGVAWAGVGNGLQVEWLLNYRGGSFLLPADRNIQTLAARRGVSLESVSNAALDEIYTAIANENMDRIQLEKAPKIAVYTPNSKQPWDDAVTLVLTYADIPYDKVYDAEVLAGELEQYDWLHLHHEDFTGQMGKFFGSYRNAAWYQENWMQQQQMAGRLGYATVPALKRAVALAIRAYVAEGGFLFAMCSATDALDIALAGAKVDIVATPFDGTPPDPGVNDKLDYSATLAFTDFTLITDPLIYEYSDIDTPPSNRPRLRGAEADFFTLFNFSAKWDPIPTMLTQNHSPVVRGFMGQTTMFRRDRLKASVTILGEIEDTEQIKYIHGKYGKGLFTYYGGHDPEDYTHAVGDPPTQLDLHRNSPGYRLILNNILFPAAKKKKRKT
jgi:hypothetical protein